MKKNIQFSIVGVIVVLALLAAFWFFGFFELRGMKRRVEALDGEKSTLENRRANLQSLETFIGNIAADQERLNGVFIGEPALVGFFERLEQLAGGSNISVAIQEARLPRNADEHLFIRLHTVGNFRDTMRYLLLVTHLPYQLQFTGVEIQKNDTSKDDDEWNARYQFNVLSFE